MVLEEKIELYSAEGIESVEDKTLEEVTREVNDISANLCAMFGMPIVRIEFDGRTNRVKYCRLRDGYTIKVGLKSLLCPKYEFVTRLIHELVHVYNDSEYIVDTCGNGLYHTEAFAKQAKIFGLFCARSRNSGFAGQIDLTTSAVSRMNDDLLVDFNNYILPVGTELLRNKPKTGPGHGGVRFQAKIYEVVCPACGSMLHVQKDRVLTEEEYAALTAPNIENVEANLLG